MDILILALVAGFILYRLYTVLGKDVGVKQQPRPVEEEQPVPVSRQASAKQNMSEGLDTKLTELQNIDPGFDKKEFLSGAEQAFQMVVNGFNEGDRETLKQLLDKKLFTVFEQAIATREKNNEIWDNSLLRIQSSTITHISLKKSVAFITVKFVSDQILVTKDQKGKIIEGDPDQIDVLTDSWTFTRDLTSQDPNWLLVETHNNE